MRPLHVRDRRRRGASAIEFALTIIPLMTCILGSMEVGWYFFNVAMLDNATRVGAQEATVVASANKATIGEAAADAMWTAIGLPGSPTFTYSADNNVSNDGSAAIHLDRMTGTMTYGGITGFMGAFDNQTMTVVVSVHREVP